MTLVVARQKGHVISVVSDTGITKAEQRLGAEDRLPKVCLVNPNFAVAFAGSSELALQYLDAFPLASDFSYRMAVDYFAECHIASEQSVDFLLMFNQPVPKIIPIRQGGVHHPSKHAWVGDQQGYEAFQRYHSRDASVASVASMYEAPYLITNNESEKDSKNQTFNLLGSLRYVILDPSVPSVFGAMVALNNVEGVFKFRQYSLLLQQRQSHVLVPPAFLRRIAPELDELQNFSESCFVTTTDSELCGLAYHYMRGKLTHLYMSEKGKPFRFAEVISGLNIQEIFDRTKKDHNVEWLGSLALRTAPPVDYGIERSRWQFSQQVSDWENPAKKGKA